MALTFSTETVLERLIEAVWQVFDNAENNEGVATQRMSKEPVRCACS